MPNISVIVPVYKVEAFLRRCVDSILSQTYDDFELILVDDGSPDNSGAICEEYAAKDDRIHVIHRTNGGLSAARNTGIDWAFANSDSQWLAFVDSDDWVHPEFLERLHLAAVQHRCLISVCGFYHTDGGEISEEEDFSSRCMSADDYYCSDEFGNATPAACGKLYHRSLFENLRYPVGKLHEDEFTTYQTLYQAENIAVMTGRMYAYYQNPEGITHSRWNPRRMDVLEAFEQQMAFAENMENQRLLKKVAEGYLFAVYEQLGQSEAAYRIPLRQKLREGIRLWKKCGLPAGIQWAYEAAYPCKVFWWIASKVRKV